VDVLADTALSVLNRFCTILYCFCFHRAGPGRTGGMEGTIDVLGHELMEAVTDPDVANGGHRFQGIWGRHRERGPV